MNGEHIPVLLSKTLELLAPRPGDIVFDGTLGGGGHARALLDRVRPGGRLIALDRDGEVLARTASTLPADPAECFMRQADFADFPLVLDSLGIAAVDVMLLDLGVSSFQLDEAARGFSFQQSGPLDMRMDRTSSETAADVVNSRDAEDLANIFYQYGEERFSRRIARRIVERRQRVPFTTTDDLAAVVLSAQPRHGWQRIHPATRVFQALRIYVNHELESLERFCAAAPGGLRPGGRVGVISFHSLEDRIVKTAFKKLAAEGLLEIVTKKPVTADDEEQASNPRSRSAKFRVARRTEKQ